MKLWLLQHTHRTKGWKTYCLMALKEACAQAFGLFANQAEISVSSHEREYRLYKY